MREQYRKQGKKDEDIDKLDLKDDVLRRANGFYTYFAGDIAYHRNKFAVRHFDKVINIGALTITVTSAPFICVSMLIRPSVSLASAPSREKRRA